MTSHKKDVSRRGAGSEPSPQEINMLVAMFNQKRYAEMEAFARKLTVRLPDHGLGWKAIGTALLQQGRIEEALAPLQKAAELSPGDSQPYNNLGNTFVKLGRLQEAETSYRSALEINPGFAEAHNNLGNTLQKQYRLPEAETSYRSALEINPGFADAYNNLGNVLLKLGRLPEAEASFRRALEINPGFADAHHNLGNTLTEQGRLPEAEISFRRALGIRPDFAEAHYNLGNALINQGRFPEAEASYQRALEIKPDYAEAYYNLGNAFLNQGRFPEAEASYHRALEIKPDFAEAYLNLGSALCEQCRTKEAEACYWHALEIKPDDLQYAVYAHLLLPIIHESLDTIRTWRSRYEEGIEALMDTPGSLEEPGNTVNPMSFYLAYHNQNDRAVMEALRRFFRARVPDLTATAPHVPAWRPPAIRGQRIRVGFLSEYLVEHTIGNLNQGFIRHLDRSRFEVVVIHSPKAKQDAFRKELDSLADKSLSLPPRLKDQQQAVAAEELDVLFYPDIGMAPSTYFLAYARLAPVQATTWGHPDTTGLDTVDYFVSVKSFEPEGSEAYYTETLVRMNRLNCFYQRPEIPGELPTRSALGLPETGTLYGCPQTLFKFHPDFDAVLAAIAEGDPAGRIVLLEGKRSTWVDLLKARWKKNFPVLLERVLFLPAMPRNHFIALQAHMDVLLDTVYFGGGNTFYEAMAYGTPMVTCPGPFMRSRIAAGGYWQMGVADAPVALRLEDYAPLALALGRDPERRRALRVASLEAAGRELFADMRAIREFEAFLEAAVDAAGRGEKLTAAWRPCPIPFHGT